MFPIDINKEGKKRMRKCKLCRKSTFNKKFCSIDCHNKSRLKPKIKRKCQFCKKIFYVIQSKGNSKFCSWKCAIPPRIKKKCQFCKKVFYVTECRKNAKFCLHKCFFKYQKKHQIGFYNKKMQSKIGKIGGKIGGKRVHELHPNHANECGKKSAKINKENKTGAFYDPKIRRETQLNISRNRGTFIFNRIRFDSNSEREFALNIHYQIEKLKLWKNYQFIIGLKPIDFYIKKFDCFIEYHPYDRKFSHTQYYDRRRKVLNNGGYKDSNLLVIK